MGTFFVHTLDEIPRIWYISVELQREIRTWEDLTTGFAHTFSFISVDSVIHSTMQHIHDIVLEIDPTPHLIELNK